MVKDLEKPELDDKALSAVESDQSTSDSKDGDAQVMTKTAKKKSKRASRRPVAIDPEMLDLADEAVESDRFEVVAATHPDLNAAEEVVVELREDPEPDESEQPADTQLPGQPSRQAILTRLLEKNEVILQLTKKNSDLEDELKSLEHKRVRSANEFENYRKRTRKEWDLLRHQTRAEVILELLEVVDNFERAMDAAPEEQDDFIEGIRLIYNNMLSTLKKLGVHRMTAVGMEFDPNLHMSVAHIDSKDATSNHVVEVILDGYLLDGTVIRPAKVVIAK